MSTRRARDPAVRWSGRCRWWTASCSSSTRRSAAADEVRAAPLLERRLAPIVVINKSIARRAPEVLNEIYDLFIDLDANGSARHQCSATPASARRQGPAGAGRRSAAAVRRRRRRAAAAHQPDAPRCAEVANLDSSDYVGGSRSDVSNGRVKIGDAVASPPHWRSRENSQAARSTAETDRHSGSGGRRHRLPRRHRGHHDRRDDHRHGHQIAIPPIAIDRPRCRWSSVNTSPMAESRRPVSDIATAADRPIASCSATSRSPEPTDSPEQVKVVGRGSCGCRFSSDDAARRLRAAGVAARHRPPRGSKARSSNRWRVGHRRPEDHQGIVIAQVGERKGRDDEW